MKMRLLLWSLGLLALQVQGDGSCPGGGNQCGVTGTELANPRKWKANLGDTDVKQCDRCRCTGQRKKKCNVMTGNFDPEESTCAGLRVWRSWGPWTNWGQCKGGSMDRSRQRTCDCTDPEGCFEHPVAGKLFEDEPGSLYDACKGVCLCPGGACPLTTLKHQVQNRAAGPFFCEPTSLLPFCNSNGECQRQGYQTMHPDDPLHPQKQGKLNNAVGGYNCPDMWPRVKIDGNQREGVLVKARCGCGYSTNGLQTRTCKLNADGCGASWSEADRSQCVKIDWSPGCEDWSACTINSGGPCGAGTQRCRRKCNTGNYQDCVHAAHAGCIDPNTHLEKQCNIAPPDWSHWGPWGWVRDGKFHTGWEQPEWNEKAIHYLNENVKNPPCGMAEQVRYYQCAGGERKRCIDACNYNCYTDQRQREICQNNKGSQRVKGRECSCEEEDPPICPQGKCV